MNHTFVYLLESPRRGASYNYQKRMSSLRTPWNSQRKITRSTDFCAGRIDVIRNFAVMTNAVIKTIDYI